MNPFALKANRKELARRIGIPTGTITRLLKRKGCADLDLLEALQGHLTGRGRVHLDSPLPEYGNVSKEPFINYETSTHWIFLCPPIRRKGEPGGNPFWVKRGHKSDVARAVRILPASLSNILRRRAVPSIKTAIALERVTGVPRIEWLNCRSSLHPAFYGKPEKGL